MGDIIEAKKEISKVFYDYGFHKLLTSVPQNRLGDIITGLALKGNQSNFKCFQQAFQVFSCLTFRARANILQRPRRNDPPAVDTAAGSHVDDIIRIADHIQADGAGAIAGGTAQLPGMPSATDDFPEPETPAMPTILWRGISRSIFFRLCTRAPRTSICLGACFIRSSMLIPFIYSNFVCSCFNRDVR